MSILVPEQVREALDVHVVSFLGGRLNKHWLVDVCGHKLVLRRWAADREDAGYERDLRQAIRASGWPVAREVTALTEVAGGLWSLAEFLPGEPHPEKNSAAELSLRGRLMAEFHQVTASLNPGRRKHWRLPDEILSDDRLEQVFEHCPDVRLRRLLLWHLQRGRQLAAGLPWSELSLQLIHGDFTPWNLLYREGRLSGLLDCEMSRPEYRISEFALSWRGRYDALIHAYHAVSPLSAPEWNMLTPAWWALLLEGAYRNLVSGTEDQGWTTRMLLRRSPLMGVESCPC